MGRKMSPVVRGVAYGCAIAAMIALAGPASAQTPIESRDIAGSVAFAPVPVESRLSLPNLQITPISTWKMSDADLEKLRADALIAPQSIVSASPSPVARAKQSVHSNRALKRTIAGIAGGVGGFFAGGIIGAKLEGDCNCDDPGLLGAVIGAPIGAAVGAIVGVWSAR
jgi:hypothetical protein